MANLAELFKSCKYLSPLNVVCVLKIITFRFTLNYNISFYNSLTFRFGGLIKVVYELYKKNPNNDRICQNLVTLCDMCIMEYVIADKWGASSVKSILDSLNNNKSAAFNRHKGKLAQSYSNIWNQLDINSRMLLMGRSVPGRSLNDKGWALKAGLDYYKKLGDVRSSSSSRLSGLAGLDLFDDLDLPF